MILGLGFLSFFLLCGWIRPPPAKPADRFEGGFKRRRKSAAAPSVPPGSCGVFPGAPRHPATGHRGSRLPQLLQPLAAAPIRSSTARPSTPPPPFARVRRHPRKAAMAGGMVHWED